MNVSTPVILDFKLFILRIYVVQMGFFVEKKNKLLLTLIVVVFVIQLLSHILILPPFEGFDEIYHYSYISVLSDSLLIPDFRYTPLDKTIKEDFGELPHTYDIPVVKGAGDNLNYYEFFKDVSLEKRRKIFKSLWEKPEKKAHYKPGILPNGEGQHPPLYYMIMIFPYRIAKEWSPGSRIFFLRLFSIILVFGSLIFWIKSIFLVDIRAVKLILLFAGLTVLFIPSLFFDLGRIGNDSLCALIFSGIFYFQILACKNRQKRIKDFYWLGLLIGLGIVTKIFFLAVMIGVVICNVLIKFKFKGIGTKILVTRILLLIFLPLLLSGWWFVLYYMRYGMMFGNIETYMFSKIANPPGYNLTLFEFLKKMIRIVMAFVATFFYSGTWSWVHRKIIYYACFLPVLIIVLIKYVKYRYGFCSKERNLLYMSSILLFPLLLGFIYQMYLRVKYTGSGSGIGGYYLFFAWPAVGVLLSVYFRKGKSMILNLLTFIFLLIALFSEVTGFWFFSQVYSGIVVKIDKAGAGYIPLAFSNLNLVLQRLKFFVFPFRSFILFFTSIIIKIYLAFRVILVRKANV